MVDEFSAFARMPQPVLKPEDLSQIVRESLVLQRNANTEISYETHLPDSAITAACDRRLLGQALTNLFQNAADAIAMRPAPEDGAPLPPGLIDIAVEPGAEQARVIVEDNGVGLPTGEHRERLTEPYVTHKTKGTGLGLAIVKKIMEDHGGRLVLEDREGGPGARAVLILPLRQDGTGTETEAGQDQAQGQRLAHGA
jgi:two-component system nitrogen regulation sensor histidine kinase NtrY